MTFSYASLVMSGGGAAPVLVVFAVLAASRSINNLCGPMLMATGRPGTVAVLSWSLAFVNVTAFLAVAWLAHDGDASGQALLMAAARTAPFALLYLPITLTLASRAAGSSIRGLLRELFPVMLSVPLIVGVSRTAHLAARWTSERCRTTHLSYCRRWLRRWWSPRHHLAGVAAQS